MNHSQAIQQLSALFLKDEESESLQRYHNVLNSIESECHNQIQEIENVKQEQEDELDRLMNETVRSYPKEKFEAKILQMQRDIESERQKHDENIRTREALERKLEYLKEETERLDQKEDREMQRHKEAVPEALKKRRVYANILPIVWQDTKDKVKGFFHYGDYVEPFEFDKNADSQYVTDCLWKIHCKHHKVSME